MGDNTSGKSLQMDTNTVTCLLKLVVCNTYGKCLSATATVILNANASAIKIANTINT